MFNSSVIYMLHIHGGISTRIHKNLNEGYERDWSGHLGMVKQLLLLNICAKSDGQYQKQDNTLCPSPWKHGENSYT